MKPEITTKAFINDGFFKDMPGLIYYAYLDGKQLSEVYETADIAYLGGLAHKYGGANSQFVGMACRMLIIKSVWAE